MAVRGLGRQWATEFHDYVQSTATTQSSNCIEFWQNHKDTYPKLYQLHTRHHTIPATSAGIERAFSLAGIICSERRNRLVDSIFESLLVAKSNKDLL